jgi:hypothetical protein
MSYILFTVNSLCVVCEVYCLVKETVFVIETACNLCVVQVEAEETVERQVYNVIEHNQIAALHWWN